MKTNKLYALLLMMGCLMMAACTKKEVSFTYKPAEPRAGETIYFTNNTEDGENWEWNFGDGSSSTSKSPSKVYKKAGTYTVTLKVDEKAYRTYSQTICVYDTVPTITCADSLIYYYEPCWLDMSAYNPYSYDVTYQWELNDDVVLVDGELDERQIQVYFREHSDSVAVRCHLTIGEKAFDCEQKFFVNDTTAPALMMATTDGRLLRQRLFEYDEEEPVECPVVANALLNAQTIICQGDWAYLFNADKTTNGGVYGYNIVDSTSVRILYNAVAGEGQGFYNGNLKDQYLYWTSEKDGVIYYAPANVTDRAFTAGGSSALYWGDICHTGYGLSAGSTTAGLCLYNDLFFMAYSNGIYRFAAADRGGSTTPSAGAILTGENILRFAFDPIAKKIYFLTGEGLSVCSINGENIRKITSNITNNALVVDNYLNCVLWTAKDGVWYMPLIQTTNNAYVEEPKQLNEIGGIRAIGVDATPRFCRNMSDTWQPTDSTTTEE